jgi:hypothetical protein
MQTLTEMLKTKPPHEKNAVHGKFSFTFGSLSEQPQPAQKVEASSFSFPQ